MKTARDPVTDTVPGNGRWQSVMGIGVVCSFAALWAWMGAGALDHGTTIIRVAAVLASVVLLSARAATIGGNRVGPVNRRMLSVTIAGEVVALWILGVVLDRWSRPDLVLSGIAIIVGLHFFPMAKAVGIPAYRMTAAVMTAIGIGSLALTEPSRTPLLCFGSAIILWFTIARPLQVA